jgi:predicted PurR-regulated permease PerM
MTPVPDDEVPDRSALRPAALAASWPERAFPGLVLLTLTAIALYLCYLMARPFVTSLAWATALAVAGWPLQRRLARWLRSRTAAAVGTVTAITLLVVVPAVMLAPAVIGEAIAGYRLLEARLEAGTWDDALRRYDTIRVWWEWINARIDIADVVRFAGSLLTAAGAIAVKASLIGAVEFLLVFFFLFFLLRDRDTLLETLRSMVPLSRAETDGLLRTAGDTIIATVFGKLAVGVVQGVLGGAMFWWLELPAPWFWAIAMGVLSIVPIVGPAVVWGPAAVLLALDGQWLSAVVLASWGAAVVGLADNVLYPIVVGRFLHLHTVALLIALIGGLVLFGAAGFFLGPVVLALTVGLLQVWRARAGLAAGPDRA